MCPGVRDDVHLEAVDRDDVAVAEALGAEPVRRVERAHAAAHPLGERPRGLGVVEVVVGQQHDGDVAGARRDRVEVRRDRRARVDHHRAAARRARAAPRCWCRRASSCSAFGRQHAARPLAERPARPRLIRAAAATSSSEPRSRSGIESVGAVARRPRPPA